LNFGNVTTSDDLGSTAVQLDDLRKHRKRRQDYACIMFHLELRDGNFTSTIAVPVTIISTAFGGLNVSGKSFAFSEQIMPQLAKIIIRSPSSSNILAILFS
jgi:hypothetical protein